MRPRKDGDLEEGRAFHREDHKEAKDLVSLSKALSAINSQISHGHHGLR